MDDFISIDHALQQRIDWWDQRYWDNKRKLLCCSKSDEPELRKRMECCREMREKLTRERQFRLECNEFVDIHRALKDLGANHDR